ncbi:MAG: hypothetical protein NVS1B6_14370 [Steroidobacteraceae bacterium]
MKKLGDWLIRTRVGPSGAFTAGHHYVKKGKWAIAEEAFGDAQRLSEEKYGSRHDWVQQAMAYRAWCLMKLRRLPEAVALYEQAIAAEEENHGANTPRAAHLRDHLRATAAIQAAQDQTSKDHGDSADARDDGGSR